jgi:hypothetical protein
MKPKISDENLPEAVLEEPESEPELAAGQPSVMAVAGAVASATF